MGSVNLASYAYDDLSRRATITRGNGTTTTYGYSTQSALSSLAHDLAGTAQDISWSYNRNQVQEITGNSWSNDGYQWTDYTNGTRNYTNNGLNQYINAAGASIIYDSKANLAADGTWTYSYDADNHLTSANKSDLTTTLLYDPIGRLRQRATVGTTNVTIQSLYDGVNLIAEYDAANILQRRFVHGPGVDEPLVQYEGVTTTNKSWFYADHQGSVVATADSAGVSTGIYSYGPYGEPSIGGPARFRYTGQQYFADLGLYYYKARFYSPTLGKFMQTDPIGYADDLNLYAYVGGNPVNFTDPMGKELVGALVGTVVGVSAGYVSGGYIGAFFGGIAGGLVGLVAPQYSYAAGEMVGGGMAGAAASATVFQAQGVIAAVVATVATNAVNGDSLNNGMGWAVAAGLMAPLASGEMFVIAAGRGAVGTIAANSYSTVTGVASVVATAMDPGAQHGFNNPLNPHPPNTCFK